MSNKRKRTSFQNLALVTQLGLNSAIPIIFGVWLGGKLDDKLGFNGLFVIIFLVLGGLTAIFNIYKLAGPRDKNRDED